MQTCTPKDGLYTYFRRGGRPGKKSFLVFIVFTFIFDRISRSQFASAKDGTTSGAVFEDWSPLSSCKYEETKPTKDEKAQTMKL